MSVGGGYDRDQLRSSYVEAWRRKREGAPLTPLQAMLADVIAAHPEYHAVVQDDALATAFEPAGVGQTNPFLHFGLHVAVREQIGVDRPPGIRALYQRLLAAEASPHAAEHALMDALAETLWEAQRSGGVPDEQAYLARVRHRLR